ncbi:MAG: hypothetical protein ACPG4U_00640 [Pseudomonadales bacterium]
MLLVPVNAVVGFSFGYPADGDLAVIAGMLLAICSWIVIYSYLEYWLRARSLERMVRALTLGAVVRALLQCLVVIDMWAGVLASGAVELLGLTTLGLAGAYYQSMMTAVLLSLLVALFPLGLMGYRKWLGLAP